MKDAYRIGVFISSKMGESNSKYNNARKHLNHLLDQNEMIRVDSVDEIGASNDHPMDDALRLLENSQICIFMFDKSEEISKYVIEEHNFAKNNEIVRLYYFCKADADTHSTVTALLNELHADDRGGDRNGRLYATEDCFADIVFKAYTNVLEEIAKGYSDIRKQAKIDKMKRPLSLAGANETSIAVLGDV